MDIRDIRTVNRASLLALCGCLAAACGSDEKPDPTRVKLKDAQIVNTFRADECIPLESYAASK